MRASVTGAGRVSSVCTVSVMCSVDRLSSRGGSYMKEEEEAK